MMQNLLKVLSDNSCLFCCYVYIFSGNKQETLSRTLSYLSYAIQQGWVDTEATVLRPDLLGQFILNKSCIVYTSKENNTRKNQIARFFNPRTLYSHFVVVDPDNNVVYDPLVNSVTVKEGYIVDYRIIE